jgi:hypothetical protein
VQSDPLIRQIRKVANSAAPAASNLGKFLRSTDRHDGFRKLLSFAYRAAGAFNAFDDLGHFGRAFLLITNCNDYETTNLLFDCIAKFKEPVETTSKADKRDRKNRRDDRDQPDTEQEDERGEQDEGSAESAPEPATPGDEPAEPDPVEPGEPPLETEPQGPSTPTTPEPEGAEPGIGVAPSSASASRADMRALLDFLIGDEVRRDRADRRGKRG